MTREFDHTREAFASSLPGRLIDGISRAIDSAWRSSSARPLSYRIAGAATIRNIATAIAIAALIQPVLMWMMPLTVRPAMPWWGFVLMGLLAAAIASQADAIGRAWLSSPLRKAFGF